MWCDDCSRYERRAPQKTCSSQRPVLEMGLHLPPVGPLKSGPIWCDDLWHKNIAFIVIIINFWILAMNIRDSVFIKCEGARKNRYCDNAQHFNVFIACLNLKTLMFILLKLLSVFFWYRKYHIFIAQNLCITGMFQVKDEKLHDSTQQIWHLVFCTHTHSDTGVARFTVGGSGSSWWPEVRMCLITSRLWTSFWELMEIKATP